MRVQIQLRIVTDDDTVLSDEVIACFDKGDDQLEEIGLSLEQAKTMLAGAQTSLVAAQAASFLTRHRDCAPVNMVLACSSDKPISSSWSSPLSKQAITSSLSTVSSSVTIRSWI